MGSSRAPLTITAKRKRKNRKTLLSSTRPNHVLPAKSTTISSTAGRAVIRSYHTLHKRLSTAIACNDDATAISVRQEIDSLGGLKKYQDASFAGQGKDRGGDTSGMLVTWLSSLKDTQADTGLRILEVGALEVNNACARCNLFRGGIERIDLKSRHPDIKEQDFMDRPLPAGIDDAFDVVSLSLVVNFVGDLKGRGNMLRRVSNYLRPRPTKEVKTKRDDETQNENALSKKTSTGISGDIEQLLPALFLVLPAPCVNNSRYLDEEKLTALMEVLGYIMVRRKMSAKLVYYLWHFHGIWDDEQQKQARVTFAKEEIRKGKSRNNFAIVLK